MSVDMGHIEAVARVLADMNLAVNYWERGTPYTDDAVRNCEIFVVILPDSKWFMPVSQLPAGTSKELKIAAERGIPIYTAYLSHTDSQWRIYESGFKLGHNTITGISGSSDHLKKYLQDDNFVFTKRAPYNLEDNHSSLKIKGERTLQDMIDKEMTINQALRNKYAVSVDPAVKDAIDMMKMSMSQIQNGLKVPSDYITEYYKDRAGVRMPIFPKEKLQEQVKKLRDLEYDERLLLFYKPSK